MTRRRSNWPSALVAFIESKRKARFDWATNNCGFFACDWLAIVVGVDPAQPYRGQIDSALSARRVVKAAGGIEAIAQAAADQWRWERVPPSRAQRGDVISWQDVEEDGPALGVCVGSLSYFANRDGLVTRATLKCRTAWRIG